MRAMLFSAVVLLSGLGASAAEYVPPKCDSAWNVKAIKQSKFISVQITEKEEQGAACDLLIRSFDYIEGMDVLSVEVVPVKHCPLDAIKHRTASLQWQLPFGARQASKLHLIVNGEKVGALALTNENIAFEGNCQ